MAKQEKLARKTNPALVTLVRELRKKSWDEDAPIWRDIASRLEGSLRNWAQVNVSKIDMYLAEGESAVVAGKVLAAGEITKKATVAAWAFSEVAREKINAAGGRCISIDELANENPKGTNVRIMG
ncbi:MAG: 50S ribosomal protein L18e [Thermoplasmata archaeon HGW-Thermoplasmata-1]|nr:MAG: 50S ribosomal protein L18e [Thermoplasmata archaeon HGW-Thermoplasmata-1]